MFKTFCIVFILLVSTVAFSADLSKPVSLSVNGERFTYVCDYLSKQTGINIQAGESDQDWNVYDRRAFIYVKNVSLKALLDGICDIFNFTCIEKSDGTLVLIQAKEQLESEAEMVISAVAKDRDSLTSKKNKGIEDILKYSNISDASFKETYPYGYILGNNAFGKSLTELFSNSAFRSAVLDTNPTRFSYQGLDKASQDILYKLFSSYAEIEKNIDVNKAFEDKDKVYFIFNRPTPDEEPQLEKETVLSRITLMYGENKIDLPILYPENRYTNLIASALLDLKSGKDEKAVSNDLMGKVKELKGKEISDKWPEDMGLSAAIFGEKVNIYSELKSESASYNDIVKVLAKKTNINIISDCFYRTSYEVNRNDLALTSYIYLLCSHYDLKAYYSDNILKIKDNKWFLKRAGEIPSVWIDYWSDISYANKGYTLDDLVQMSALTDLQIDYELALSLKLNRLIKFGNTSMNINTKEVNTKRNILRFLGSLSDEQHAKLKAGKIMAYDLTDEQWALLEKGITESDTTYIKQPRASQMITLKTNAGRYVDYELSVFVDLTSPKYGVLIVGNQIILDKK